MEAVCYFCLCAISQYRLKKAATNSTSNKSSKDLLIETYQLLSYLNGKLVKTIENETIVKKFKVLLNWMESFINRWLWLMSFNEIKRIKESITELNNKLSSSSQTNNNNNTSTTSNTTTATSTTSPNELAPSPASSVGSSIGSNNGNSNNSNQPQSTSTTLNHADLNKKLLGTYESYYKLNEYNLRSQNIWDSNEHLINDVKYLADFRDIVKQQVQRDLHIDCEAELFAAYIITGLQLFKLDSY